MDDIDKNLLMKRLKKASSKIDSETTKGKAAAAVHYWLSYALIYGVENAVTKWTEWTDEV